MGASNILAIWPRLWRLGRKVVMIGSLLAGTAEKRLARSISIRGAPIKAIAAWDLLGPCPEGSADRYFQGEVSDQMKFVPEGIEGQVAFKGPVSGCCSPAGRRLAGSHGLYGSRQPCKTFATSRNLSVSVALHCVKAMCMMWPSPEKAPTIP